MESHVAVKTNEWKLQSATNMAPSQGYNSECKKESWGRIHTIWIHQYAVEEDTSMWQNLKEKWTQVIKIRLLVSFARETGSGKTCRGASKVMKEFHFFNWVVGTQICITLFIVLPYTVIGEYYFGFIQSI